MRVGFRTAAAGIGAIAVIVTLGLTGCTGSGFSVLDRDAGPGDALPANLPDNALNGLEPSSVRFAGRYDGDRLYVAKGSAPHRGESVCLLVYPEESEGGTSVCGPSQVSVDNGLREYVLHIDSAYVPDGAVQISPNIFLVEHQRR